MPESTRESMPSSKGLRTRSIHAGEPRPLIEDAVTLPIFQTSTYLLGDVEDYDSIRYMRLNNSPNHLALGEKIASLEGGEAGLVAASGMAAITTTLLALVAPGSHLIAQDCLYGGTRAFLDALESLNGVSVSFVSLERPDEWTQALRPETKAFYAESLTNPLVQIGRLDDAARFAREHGLTSLIDNTFPTPVGFRPIELGFDVVLHSATKYLNGHSDIVAGAVVGSQGNVAQVRQRLNLLGGSLDANACFLLNRGLKTLPLRVQAQCETALALARALGECPGVEKVHYPGLESDPSYARARAWFSYPGAMLCFQVAGGEDGAERVLERLSIPLVAPSLGGVETLVARPANTSHAGVSAETRQALGIGDGLIRVSVGLEDTEDLLADFRRALG